MVSLWPWKAEKDSPASFEKILSVLSANISKASSRLENTRQRSRRLTVLWTLYAGFTYLLYTTILILVVGWRKWGPVEYTTVSGGPVIMYLVRLGLSTYYGYRISSIQTHLDELEQQRDKTIEKLKAATKYNSTQELLKKYGGTPTPKAKRSDASDPKENPKSEALGTPTTKRTGFAPPPTANISGRDMQTSYQSSQRPSPRRNSPAGERAVHPIAIMTPQSHKSFLEQDTSAEFAPNAFTTAPQYARSNESSRWYDRILDVLLGEDETAPKARLALICGSCRLVNGQAPPGVKRLEDVGKWFCHGCGAMNGEENETASIVANIERQVSTKANHDEKDEGVSSEDKAAENTLESPSMNDKNIDDPAQYSSRGSTDDEDRGKMNVSPSIKDFKPSKHISTRQTKDRKMAV